MKCELLTEQNLALLHDFVDDENTRYDEAVLKAFLHREHAYTGGRPEFGIYHLDFGSYEETFSDLEKFKDERLT